MKERFHGQNLAENTFAASLGLSGARFASRSGFVVSVFGPPRPRMSSARLRSTPSLGRTELVYISKCASPNAFPYAANRSTIAVTQLELSAREGRRARAGLQPGIESQLPRRLRIEPSISRRRTISLRVPNFVPNTMVSVPERCG